MRVLQLCRLRLYGALLTIILVNAAAFSQTGQWQLLAKGHFVSTSVERRVYRTAGSDRFFVHIRIQNTSAVVIGVDLNHYFKVFYPNQWSVHQAPHRDVVDEERMIPKLPDEGSAKGLLSGLRNNTFSTIKPGLAIGYYREFNASTINDIEKAKGNYLIVSMDGQIDVTDGKTIETLALEWRNGKDMSDTDVVIPYPIEWKRIPVNSLVIKE